MKTSTVSPSRDRGSAKSTLLWVVSAVVVVLAFVWFGPSFLRNPFNTETKDYSAPLVLTELRDLADFHAAQAQFEIVIDQEEDVNLVPSFLAGERVQFVAVGSVDGIVDFSGLGEGAITIDEENDAVTVMVPEPTLGTPVIDMENSGVMNRDRGIFNRLGSIFEDSPTSERELVQAAQDKMLVGAESTDLRVRTEENTERVLSTMLGAMGFEQITVEFVPPSE